jgi:hypothetical protein
MTPRRSPVFALAAAALCAALAAGCAPTTTSTTNLSKFKGPQRQVAQTVADLRTAAGDDDDRRICTSILSRDLAARLASHGRGCPAVVHEAIRDADSLDMTVQSVQVTGARATARVKLETGKKDRFATLGLVREGAGWRIAGL